MATITYTTPGPCSCCGATPIACACALLIPALGGTFTYANAVSAITNNVAAGCIGYIDSAHTTFTAVPTSSTVITLDATFSASGKYYGYASITIPAATTITAVYSVTGGFVIPTLIVYDCAWNFIDGGTAPFSTSGTLVLSTIFSAGTYYIAVTSDNSTAWNFAVTVNTSLIPNPVIALWDDGGTTRRLWACPKLQLPPLTESTGTWYANSGAAATAISTLTSNCVGYIESMTNVTTFTATDGGATLTLAEALTSGATSCPTVWGGINAVNAATLTFTLTVGAGTAKIAVNIYDDTGAIVQASGLQNSPWTSSGLSYKGRYTFSVAMSSTLSTTSYSTVVNSSGTMTVNPVQALWDNSLICASRTDC